MWLWCYHANNEAELQSGGWRGAIGMTDYLCRGRWRRTAGLFRGDLSLVAAVRLAVPSAPLAAQWIEPGQGQDASTPNKGDDLQLNLRNPGLAYTSVVELVSPTGLAVILRRPRAIGGTLPLHL